MAKEEKKKMIDLSNVQVPNIDGTFGTLDVAKDVASLTYNSTQNLEVVSACMDLFKTGKCEWTEKVKEDLTKTVNNLVRVVEGEQIPFGIVIKKAIIDAIG
jgi:hypothetical protein